MPIYYPAINEWLTPSAVLYEILLETTLRVLKSSLGNVIEDGISMKIIHIISEELIFFIG